MISLSGSQEHAAIHRLEEHTRGRERSLQSLASGKRANLTPVEQVLSAYLMTQVDGMQQATTNSESAADVIRTAQGALQEVNDRVRDIRRLSVAAANTGVYDVGVREAFQSQVQSDLQAIQNFATQTQFNGKNLLDGTYASPAATVQFQVGPDTGQTVHTTLTDARTTSLGSSIVTGKSLADITVTTEAGASEALQLADAARVEISQQSATMGAMEANTLRPVERALQHRILALMQSHSRLADTDYAAESRSYINRQIMIETGIAAVSSAIIDRQRSLVLLR